ncbi:two-component system sensor histidine kinase CreC [Caldimonas brevitalea]|uniref:histidine kinase n=1 Tax=Caldimonas brevitalea TaxID=413882 RepID=A0A0G3BRX6_9BURK|nr:two-component system sensor histidine kinase CreC [Caldimonas brevitalea]AKJ32184.1 histidine kinase [Caldimonas brevitalea]
MKLGLRLFLGFFLIAGIAAFFVLRVFVAEVKPSVREVMEDIMVDTANLLAEQVADEMAALPPGATLASSRFAERVRAYASRPIDAKIWGLSKQTLDFGVYVTDASGTVLFDSRPGMPLGRDYSLWNDVARTLRGEYGARATREVYLDDLTSVMYVGAPVKHQGRIIGVLTVAKPLSTVQKFVARAERKILVSGLWLLALSLAVGVAVTGWLVWSVRRLRHYAQHVQAGRAPKVPQLSGELGDLAVAVDAMRERLEDREHLEHVVRALTHELKSPLAAIHGAAELLQDELPAPDRHQFALQITEQSERLRLLVDRMLELSKLEGRRALDQATSVSLRTLVERVLADESPQLARHGVTPRWLSSDDLTVHGDAELLHLALSNIVQNAIDFAPPGSTLDLSLRREGGHAVVEIRDHGPGVADYALPHLGERFYSTVKHDGKKGSGLGLAIVRQVAELHTGGLELLAADPGLRVRMRLPLRSYR